MAKNVMPDALAHQSILSRRHLQLLALLVIHGRLNITAAARLLFLSQSFTSRLAGHLVDLDYAKREKDDNDLRETYFSPTATGRAADATMRRRIQQSFRSGASRPELRMEDIELIVSTVFDRIAQALANGQRVELRGFGTFTVKRREARIGRNPRNREAVPVPAKAVLFFKAGSELRDRVNHPAGRRGTGT